jgi:hypothetical protein
MNGESVRKGTWWLQKFSRVMADVYGPVTGVKSIYENNKGYLIMVRTFTDMQRQQVSWCNTVAHDG